MLGLKEDYVSLSHGCLAVILRGRRADETDLSTACATYGPEGTERI
jgi:hypothetical protein